MARLSEAHIVGVARGIILDGGCAALTIRRLSDRLGVSLGATYHHVAGKEQLLLLVGRDLLRESVARSGKGGSWDVRLRRSLRHLAALLTQHDGMAAVVLERGESLGPSELHLELRRLLGEFGYPNRRAEDFVDALVVSTVGACVAARTATARTSRRPLVDVVIDHFVAAARSYGGSSVGS